MNEKEHNLTWKGSLYSNHLREILCEMLTSHKFSDVTLVCDDRKEIQAHRNMLSASSPVFKNVLQAHTHNNDHLVIYLGGVAHSEMESIMQFIYLGETTFYAERMKELILVAENLEINEFIDSVETNQSKWLHELRLMDEDTENMLTVSKDGPEDYIEYTISDNDNSKEMKNSQDNKSKLRLQYNHEDSNHKGIAKDSVSTDKRLGTKDKVIRNGKKRSYSRPSYSSLLEFKMMDKDNEYMLTINKEVKEEYIESIKNDNDNSAEVDNLCEDYKKNQSLQYNNQNGNATDIVSTDKSLKERTKDKIIRNGATLQCSKCNESFNAMQQLWKHKKEKHKRRTFPCNLCDYQGTCSESLTRHNRSKHEGLKYPCDQCKYQATQKHHLTNHKKSKHGGIKYSCDQCDQQYTDKSNLRSHIKSKHEGIKYGCEVCGQQFTQKADVQHHILAVHEGVSHVCSACNYKASTLTKLKTHWQEHNGLKHVCMKCDRRYKWKHMLENHIQSKHPNVTKSI